LKKVASTDQKQGPIDLSGSFNFSFKNTFLPNQTDMQVAA